MTLTEFLLARIAEDEHFGTHDSHLAKRWEAECEAKLRIVERFRWAAEDPDLYRTDMALADQWQDAMDTLTDAATVYADHPDYDEEWRRQ